jgi:hypothetical protein
MTKLTGTEKVNNEIKELVPYLAERPEESSQIYELIDENINIDKQVAVNGMTPHEAKKSRNNIARRLKIIRISLGSQGKIDLPNTSLDKVFADLRSRIR